MKKILFTMLCAAIMLSCGENKAKSGGYGDCDGQKAECAQKNDNCTGDCTGECTGDCDDCNGDCDGSDCDKNGSCDKTGDCKKSESCDKGACPSKEPAVDTAIGCIQIDNALFMSQIADYNNPEWKYLGDKPAIIDFYADWCGPCKKIAPSLDEVAKEYAGKLNVYKVNVDKCPEIAQAYGISSIPTLFFVPVDGAPTKTIGMMDKSEIEANIAKIMK